MVERKHNYIVAGKYGFPTDMLRYDSAELLGQGILPVLNIPCFLIHGFCTRDRWQSFIWTVFNARPMYADEAVPEWWMVEVSPGAWEPVSITAVKEDSTC